MLEFDAIAKNYVVAQVDFEFPDEEETVILRQQGLKDIDTIYSIDPRQLKEARLNFEDYLIHNSRWRKELPRTTFDEMYRGADALQKTLKSFRFTDERTLSKIQSLHIPSELYFTYTKKDAGVTFPPDMWNQAAKNLEMHTSCHPESINYLIAFFKGQDWNVVKDPDTERAVRSLVESEIPSQIVKFKAGARIINQGEQVTSRHITILKAMRDTMAERRNLWAPLTIISSLAYALIIMLLGGYYYYIHHKSFYFSKDKIALYATIIITTLILTKATEYVLISDANQLLDNVRFPLFVPMAAILICVLIDIEVALFTTCILAVVLGLSLAVDHSRFIVSNLITGIVAILSAQNLRKRKEVFGVCAKVWLSIIPIFFIYNFSQNQFWDPSNVSDFISTGIFMLGIAVLVVGLLPVLESLFNVMTDITLMEYMDPNNELLRRLTLEAPGTYQHCLVVGSLAEAAAQAIGANGLFCRVSTLYHDIGKLFNPHYFTENQMGGFNIHQLLTPVESAQVIIAHVTEGAVLAKKHGLPQSFIDIIVEHHGTTLVYYFYCKQVEQMGGDVDAVDEKQFRYPGPTPRTKESAIIMIADTIEAASRSMDEVDEESIRELVDRLIQGKAEEGQFDQSPLTFQELGIVKHTIIKTLTVTRHLRIKYPEKK
ncbi:MAG: HDIG domain-containing protein [Simkaniaceae bacterium]|nr:HDIG domain-containing protein [Simkaniaceae bacterium]